MLPKIKPFWGKSLNKAFFALSVLLSAAAMPATLYASGYAGENLDKEPAKGFNEKSSGEPEELNNNFDKNSDGKFNYVALGDAAAIYKSGESEHGYVKLLAERLEEEAGYPPANIISLAQSGDDTQALLGKLNDEKNHAAISEADIITISIGANNFIKVITGLFEENLGTDIESLLSMELGVLDIDISTEVYSHVSKMLAQPDIQTKFAHELVAFMADLPEIAATLNTLAPEAEVYIMALYNPLLETNPLYSLVDGIVTQKNHMIQSNSTEYGYTVVDVYSAYNIFLDNKMLLSGGAIKPVPTPLGHRLIANTHYFAITGNVSSDIIDISGLSDMESIVPLTTEPLTRSKSVAILIDGLAKKFGDLLNVESIPINNVIPFTDVSPSHPQYKQIMSARALGVISSDGGSIQFFPDTLMSRQDFACIVDNMHTTFSLFGLLSPLPEEIGQDNYGDVGRVARYARESLLKCVNSGLLNLENNLLNPFGHITAFEIAAVLR